MRGGYFSVLMQRWQPENAARLEELGFGRLKGGSLYPALSKLEDAGAVTAGWIEGAGGPARREYSITPKGGARLARERASLSSLALALGQPAHLAEGVLLGLFVLIILALEAKVSWATYRSSRQASAPDA